MARVAARNVDEYEFDSPSLHAPSRQAAQRAKPSARPELLRAQKLRPMSGQRVGGVADLELKAQLAQAGKPALYPPARKLDSQTGHSLF